MSHTVLFSGSRSAASVARLLVVAAAACFLALTVTPTMGQEDADEFTPLFNGQDLEGWVVVNTAPSTWHFEDGMPEMRAVSVSINLTENRADNGSLMVMPGSHRTFVGCVGPTPEEHYRESLRSQHYGVPSDRALEQLASAHGITQVVAPPGSALLFDSNCMHGSNGNITPYPRRNLFLVFNSMENTLVAPFGGTEPRPGHIASRDPVPLG